MNKTQRIIIYPKDIALITGRSERYGRLIIQRIRIHLDKDPHQLITIQEFSDYMGLDPDEVSSRII